MSGSEIQSLKDSVQQYEAQLEQVKLAIVGTKPGLEQDQLLSLRTDIQQLITLTKENLAEIEGTSHQEMKLTTKEETPTLSYDNAYNGDGDDDNDDDDDPFAREYALFKAELEQEDKANQKEESNKDDAEAAPLPDIKAELDALPGMKCQAPFSHGWGISYHNALVFHVEPADSITDMQQIQVRVMFTNPTEMKMLPCTYYLEGECRFDDEKCRFSHGALVYLSMLKEYREPNFKQIKSGSHVLALSSKDKLWHRGKVLHELKEGTWEVRLETASGGKVLLELKDLLPLKGEKGNKSDDEVSSNDEGMDSDTDEDGDDDDDENDDDDNSEESQKQAAMVQLSLSNNPSSALGSWERHTKGFGSRLMEKMGYVLGTGLGPKGEGRIEPVEAVVFPAGKSLDHCMKLKENADGDSLLRTEKRLRRLRRKQELQMKAKYEREKKRVNVFDFLNSQLGDNKMSLTEASPSSSLSPAERGKREALKTETNQGLNVANLRVCEEIRRAEKDLGHLQQSLQRQTAGSVAYSSIAIRVAGKEKEIRQLKESEKKITAEQNQRKGNKKMSVF